MAIVHPLKLMAIGGSLVTSTSIWLFDSKTPQPLALESSSDSTPSEVNLNSLPTIEKLPDRNGTIIENTDLKHSDHVVNHGANFTSIKNPNQGKKYLSIILQELENFDMSWIYTTREQYSQFNREEINISLFTKSAWENSTNNDIYETQLSRDQISKLFGEDLDEVKVKQLLLSLHKRLDWLFLSPTPQDTYYSSLKWPNSLEDLKDLKIKYFTDFDSLKSYVHEKVKTCTDDTKACIPTLGELNILATDHKNFVEKVWSKE